MSNNYTPFSGNDMPVAEVVIPWLVYEKIMYWVGLGGAHECSGLGITQVVDGKIRVMDAIMLKQSNSGATTDLDEQEINRAMFKLRQHDGNLNFWWHSHADMGVFWSGTDKDTIAQIGKHGMCVATVFNKKRETKTAIACIDPIRLFVDDVKLTVDGGALSAEQLAVWKDEYDLNVAEKKFGLANDQGHSASNPGYDQSGKWRGNVEETSWEKKQREQREREKVISLPNLASPTRTIGDVGMGTNTTEPGSLFDQQPNEDQDYDLKDSDEAELMEGMTDKEFQDWFDTIGDYDSETNEYVMKNGTRVSEDEYLILEKKYFKELYRRKTQEMENAAIH